MSDPFDLLGVEPRSISISPRSRSGTASSSKRAAPRSTPAPPRPSGGMALGRAIEQWTRPCASVQGPDPAGRGPAPAGGGRPWVRRREPKPSPALLMEMMEAREELAEAARAESRARGQAPRGDGAREQAEVLAAGSPARLTRPAPFAQEIGRQCSPRWASCGTCGASSTR